MTGAPKPLPRPIMGSLILLALAVAFKSANQLDADYDLWWHIFIGKDMIANQAIAYADRFSFTAFGQPYINHEWASEILVAFAYLKAGDAGLIIWRWSMVLLIFAFAFDLIRRGTEHGFSRILLALCFSAVIGPGISFRIQLFSYLFLLVLIHHMEVRESGVGLSSVIMISGMFALWSNLHGAFVLGLVVWFVHLSAHAAQGRFRNRPCPALLACLMPLAATLLNPFGYDIWRFIFSELSNPLSGRFITEWQRFSFAPRERAFLLVMLLSWSAFLFSGRRKKTTEGVFMLLASVMGLTSVRNTPLFVILALPAMARHLDGACIRLFTAASRGKASSLFSIYTSALLLTGVSVFFLMQGWPAEWKVRIGKDPLPARTVAFLKENGFKGNLWVPLHYGGYAMYHLYPDMRVSIDGRWAMVYPRRIMQDHMRFSFDGSGGEWKHILETYRARLALVASSNPAIAEMNQDTDWMWLVKEPCCGLLIKKQDMQSLSAPLVMPEKRPPAWP